MVVVGRWRIGRELIVMVDLREMERSWMRGGELFGGGEVGLIFVFEEIGGRRGMMGGGDAGMPLKELNS